MRTTFLLLINLLFLGFGLLGKGKEEDITLKTKTGDIEGTLMVPETKEQIPVALLIAGSGPTDRNGNNPYMTNNSLKMIAEGLAENGIASLRYDKRAIAKSRKSGLKEIDLRFEHYVKDAEDWIQLLKKDKRFNSVTVIGHSEGSLIGMIAAKGSKADKFVSLAGVGQSADKLLKEQLKAKPPIVLEKSAPIIDKLVEGKTVKDVPQFLFALFRPSVQPYLISWFKYDPSKEIAKLTIPVLIIQGTTDMQVGLEEAELLAKAKKDSKKFILKGMNHVLKEAPADRQKNALTYNNPNLPLKDGLMKGIVDFIGSD
jgi:pimeloyl-ACP methyl ester carboxylesterase